MDKDYGMQIRDRTYRAWTIDSCQLVIERPRMSPHTIAIADLLKPVPLSMGTTPWCLELVQTVSRGLAKEEVLYERGRGISEQHHDLIQKNTPKDHKGTVST